MPRIVEMVLNIVRDPDFHFLSGLLTFVIASGTLIFSWVEGWELFDSLYFSVITITSIGYGDMAPVTILGRSLTMIYVFLGLGILFSFINLITYQSMRHHMEQKKEEKK